MITESSTIVSMPLVSKVLVYGTSVSTGWLISKVSLVFEFQNAGILLIPSNERHFSRGSDALSDVLQIKSV